MNFNIFDYLPKLNFSFLMNITLKQILTFTFNILFVAIMFLSIIAILDIVNEKYKQDKLFGLKVDEKRKKNLLTRIKIFKIYYHNLEIFLTEKEKEGSLSFMFNLTIGSNIALCLYLISVKQILIAIIMPIIIIKALNKIVVMLSINAIEKIEEQLPYAIDNIIRTMSKYGDLRNVIFETSRVLDAPLKDIFEKLARKMISSNPETVLMTFAEEFDNVWVYSLTFTLLSYTQDANKEDVIKNLRHLRNILEKENSLKKASITDKRYGVMTNYAIACLAGIAGIAQIVLNPIGKQFFFSSFTGIICFVGGYGAILVTIIVNIMMSKTKKSKK